MRVSWLFLEPNDTPSDIKGVEAVLSAYPGVTFFQVQSLSPGQSVESFLATGTASYDILILDHVSCTATEHGWLARLVKAQPSQRVIVLCSATDADGLLKVFATGVFAVLHTPVERAELLQALQRCEEQMAQSEMAGTSAHRHALCIAVLPSKGGCGASFVATHLAYALAKPLQQRTLLVDLDLEYGDATFALTEVTHPAHVVSVAAHAELDVDFLLAACFVVHKNLWVLQSPANAELAQQMTSAQLQRLFVALLPLFDVVVMDLDHRLDTVTLQALAQADHILHVVQPRIQDLRDREHQRATLLESGFPAQRIQLVLNCADGYGVIGAQMREHLGPEIQFQLPDVPLLAQQAAVMGESIILLAPESPFSHATIDIAARLIRHTVPRPHWLQRLRQFFSFAVGSSESAP